MWRPIHAKHHMVYQLMANIRRWLISLLYLPLLVDNTFLSNMHYRFSIRLMRHFVPLHFALRPHYVRCVA